MYNKNCGKKMFGKKIYPAPGGNLMDPMVFKKYGWKNNRVYAKMGIHEIFTTGFDIDPFCSGCEKAR